MKSIMLAVTGVLAVATLSACSKAPAGDKYVCQDKVEFYIDINDDKTATLYFKGKEEALTSVPAGSGAKYVSDEHMFWSHQNEAMLGEGQNLHKQCLKQG
ncbi:MULTISPECIES: MliC family protein [unclassified Motilimonas]|uniref:MliC family protein n=1 Tax=Motilimonas TaxID=1914248 RepID=UPI001E423CFB|nr:MULTISPECIES: MliC family protein [unclassified Motilimonas]MCE0556962.1 MliC family protein [Motilimonas sp. E26]MDO6525487.1 MliC family protein [Motilimonas sp. 1_MG-2023]